MVFVGLWLSFRLTVLFVGTLLVGLSGVAGVLVCSYCKWDLHTLRTNYKSAADDNCYKNISRKSEVILIEAVTAVRSTDAINTPSYSLSVDSKD
eukprot:5045297-Amphidinium_carterae.1